MPNAIHPQTIIDEPAAGGGGHDFLARLQMWIQDANYPKSHLTGRQSRLVMDRMDDLSRKATSSTVWMMSLIWQCLVQLVGQATPSPPASISDSKQAT